MYTRIAAALIVAFLLSAGAWKAYTMGEKSVQAKWDKQTTKMTEDALKLSEENRAKEQALQTKVRKVTNDYIAEKSRRAADAVAASSKLRDLEAALDGVATSDTSATGRADGDPRLDIIAECARTANQLDGAVKEMASKTIALQAYAASVCLTK